MKNSNKYSLISSVSVKSIWSLIDTKIISSFSRTSPVRVSCMVQIHRATLTQIGSTC